MRAPLLAFYGDDFTGSTDALEALAGNGVPAVLFLDPPTPEALSAYPDCRAAGLAGDSRSRSPEWMSARLPGIFAALRATGAPMVQYKVCSTFDSAPHVGSIGRALEIGLEVFQSPWAPIVVALPHFGRYVAFGNLFASGSGAIHRIDRHPAMSRHPVTPMGESDLRRHLARQTGRRVELLDLTALHADGLAAVLAHAPDAVLFDGIDARHQLETGRLLWGGPPFGIGSSGLTYALIARWRELGLAPPAFTPPRLERAGRIVVVSGSCSPVTEAQIRYALGAGYAGFTADEPLDGALAALAAGRSVVVYSALGPVDAPPLGESLGRRLGRTLRELLDRSGVRRAVIAGGDTSSYAARELGIRALTYAAPIAPGAPLCRADNGLELVLKGGQVGGPEFFERARGVDT